MIDVYCVAHVSRSSNPVPTARVARFFRHVAYTMPLLVLLHSKKQFSGAEKLPHQYNGPQVQEKGQRELRHHD